MPRGVWAMPAFRVERRDVRCRRRRPEHSALDALSPSASVRAGPARSRATRRCGALVQGYSVGARRGAGRRHARSSFGRIVARPGLYARPEPAAPAPLAAIGPPLCDEVIWQASFRRWCRSCELYGGIPGTGGTAASTRCNDDAARADARSSANLPRPLKRAVAWMTPCRALVALDGIVRRDRSDDVVHMPVHGRVVHACRADLDAEERGACGGLGGVGGGQQRLGRHAAGVQAVAAHRAGLDQHGFGAELAGAGC